MTSSSECWGGGCGRLHVGGGEGGCVSMEKDVCGRVHVGG